MCSSESVARLLEVNVMNASWNVCPVHWLDAVLLLILKVLMARMAIAYN